MKKVELSEISKQFIKETFKDGIFVGDKNHKYNYGTLEDFNDRIVKSITIHLYPNKDTYEEECTNGIIHYKSTGLVDGLLNKAILYDNINMKYIALDGVDRIQTLGIVTDLRVFKDGSTCLRCQNCLVNLGQTIILSPSNIIRIPENEL